MKANLKKTFFDENVAEDPAHMSRNLRKKRHQMGTWQSSSPKYYPNDILRRSRMLH